MKERPWHRQNGHKGGQIRLPRHVYVQNTYTMPTRKAAQTAHHWNGLYSAQIRLSRVVTPIRKTYAMPNRTAVKSSSHKNGPKSGQIRLSRIVTPLYKKTIRCPNWKAIKSALLTHLVTPLRSKPIRCSIEQRSNLLVTPCDACTKTRYDAQSYLPVTPCDACTKILHEMPNPTWAQHEDKNGRSTPTRSGASFTPLEPPNPSLYTNSKYFSPKTGFQLQTALRQEGRWACNEKEVDFWARAPECGLEQRC